MEIWINPACSKCRSAIGLLDAEGAEYTVRRYLEDVPSEDEIREVLDRLGLEPWDITRTQEAAAKELGLRSGRGTTVRGTAGSPRSPPTPSSSSAPSSRRTTARRWSPAPMTPYRTPCPGNSGV
ncbi:hypothetical protein RKD19_005906 [Streptomyces canus]